MKFFSISQAAVVALLLSNDAQYLKVHAVKLGHLDEHEKEFASIKSEINTSSDSIV